MKHVFEIPLGTGGGKFQRKNIVCDTFNYGVFYTLKWFLTSKVSRSFLKYTEKTVSLVITFATVVAVVLKKVQRRFFNSSFPGNKEQKIVKYND